EDVAYPDHVAEGHLDARAGSDPDVVDEGAVPAPEVLERERTPDVQNGVPPRDGRVGDRDLALLTPADRHRAARRQRDEPRALAPALAPSRWARARTAIRSFDDGGQSPAAPISRRMRSENRR